MELRIVNPDPRYSRVSLLEPAPFGYLHMAAAVRPRRVSLAGVSGRTGRQGGYQELS